MNKVSSKIRLEETYELIDGFKGKRVLIVGDAMLDAYLWGKVDRISPEAPVPVVSCLNEEYKLGGAANVAQNITALGATASLCSVVGQDHEAEHLITLLNEKGIHTEGLIRSTQRPTTLKQRIYANSQHLLRIDKESLENIGDKERAQAMSYIKKEIQNCDVLIFQDYDKGFLEPKIIDAVTKLAKEYAVQIAVDPKHKNFYAYQGCTLFKPNLKEFQSGVGVSIEPTISCLKEASKKLKSSLGMDMLMVTLSEFGLFLYDFEEVNLVPAHEREIVDVSGAGDTVISVAALCLAVKATLKYTAYLSNFVGGLACEKKGVACIDAEELKSSLSRTLKKNLK